MSGSAYAGAMGRTKVQLLSLLPKETIMALANSKDVIDISKILEGTVYAPDIAAVAATYQGSTRLEVAINRLFVRNCRRTLDAAPFAGKPMVAAYLRRFDIQNVSLIIASKVQGKSVTETESFLISSREFPAGLFAGAMTLDDFRQVLQQPTIEGVTQQLVRFGYGGALLPKLDAYQRTRDIFPFLLALDQEYYAQLLRSIHQFQGDEWNVLRFVQSEIDVRNVLLLLKGKDAGLPLELVEERIIDGGQLTRPQLADLYSARAVPELVQGMQSRYPGLPEGLPAYQVNHTLTSFEAALIRDRSLRELRRLRNYPLSVSILFTHLMRAELERTDLRRIVYGKMYGVPVPQLIEQLVVPKL